jgi:ribosomal protein S18 acetylase RimI-like enzyme
VPEPASVRDATPADAAAIAVCHVRTWQAAYAGVLPAAFLADLDPAPRERAWREWIEGGGDILVAERAGRLVGFASVGPARDEPGSGELYAIYVEPEAWSSGAGRALMDAAVARLAERGYDEALLWVLEENPRARRFYERAGWSSDGGRQELTLGGANVTEVRYRFRTSSELR